MNKKRTFIIMVIALILSLFILPSSFSIYRSGTTGYGSGDLAEWNVSLEQNGIVNSLTIIPGMRTDSYTLNVRSSSDVDIKYDVIVSNLPSGVDVTVDNKNPDLTSANTLTFNNVGTILYNTNNNLNTHTLVFTATNNATFVNNQNVSINVIAKQILPS